MPADCYRNTTHWSEKYASGLRDQGYTVTLRNHACSGGRTPDMHTPRAMDTQSGRSMPAPAGVTTTADGDADLRGADPCNTRAFPDEEFWTYTTTSVSGLGTKTPAPTQKARSLNGAPPPALEETARGTPLSIRPAATFASTPPARRR